MSGSIFLETPGTTGWKAQGVSSTMTVFPKGPVSTPDTDTLVSRLVHDDGGAQSWGVEPERFSLRRAHSIEKGVAFLANG